MEERYVRRNEFNLLKGALTAAAEKDTLALEQLHVAMATFHEDWWTSVGTEWIRENPELFARAIHDPEGFLREHLDQMWCLEYLIREVEVLNVVKDPIRRMLFARDAYLHRGSSSSDWVAAALKAGVSRDVIAEMILTRLENCEVARDIKAHTDFLEQGGHADSLRGLAGFYGPMREEELRNPRPSRLTFEERPHRVITRDDGHTMQFWYLAEDRPWGVLTDEEFERAVISCARKAPLAVLQAQSNIGVRLSEAKAAELCDMAAGQIDVLGRLNPEYLRGLPVETKVGVAFRMKPFAQDGSRAEEQKNTVEFILGIVFELNEPRASGFLNRMEPVLSSIMPSVLARTAAWYIFVQETGNCGNAQVAPPYTGKWSRVWEIAERRLTDRGYIIGRVEEGSFTPKGRTRPETQYEVQHKDTLYVADRNSHRQYWPRKGDFVIIHAASSVFLAKRGNVRIYHASFVALDKRRDRD